ncbi:MAG: leucyl aminopeptidase family protein [Nitrosomonadales bacterium]|nr:leucyl aminopeptidase family protein [Nitrosomonadales bacterium]
MLAQLILSKTPPEKLSARHLLVLLPKEKVLSGDVPHTGLLKAVLARRGMKADELAKSPVSANAGNGALVAWAALEFTNDVFTLQTQVRKGVQLLLDEKPDTLAIAVLGDETQRGRAAELAVYAAWVNGAPLPSHKKKNGLRPLQKIELSGFGGKKIFSALNAQAEGNLLCRSLTMLPPNELTPAAYRARIAELARQHGWQREEFDMKKLRKIGAGAFVAVAQGSADEDAAIVRLRYTHPRARQTVALVGKGICFDTGGHNLKPARHMHNMHEDMNGSAVVLGILLAATLNKLPVNLDCWLALAQNHISPKAYKQSDIVTALNGTTIEVIHTDAEGRMVLADTLTLAARARPDWMIDFATLTGSMATALGARYSGVLGNRDELVQRAVSVGKQCGERLCAFPLDDDYEAALDTKVADIKQCTLEGEADHILATRFLKRFVDDTPWLHVDLSASRCEGGLGIVASEVNGFGVAWGLGMLSQS